MFPGWLPGPAKASKIPDCTGSQDNTQKSARASHLTANDLHICIQEGTMRRLPYPKEMIINITFCSVKKKISAKRVASSWETNPVTCPRLLLPTPLHSAVVGWPCSAAQHSCSFTHSPSHLPPTGRDRGQGEQKQENSWVNVKTV